MTTAELAEELRSTARHANREEIESELPETGVDLLVSGGLAIGYRYVKDEREVEVEFSAETGLEERRKRGSRERRYRRWRDVGGVLLPMLIEDSVGGVPTVTIELASARHRNDASAWCRSRFALGKD